MASGGSMLKLACITLLNNLKFKKEAEIVKDAAGDEK